ncbi:hypothetical protein AVEN_161088-1 [Araneus ventricosus]|uniref:Uncharacterized protein n=1 Tax=Araneus ventricosus TaxID=182803 RepID=A0A4Y2VFS8_ARAVE|nr:hypothetical protein AVEN_161088-1 [Araneus ventricosus]
MTILYNKSRKSSSNHSQNAGIDQAVESRSSRAVRSRGRREMDVFDEARLKMPGTHPLSICVYLSCCLRPDTASNCLGAGTLPISHGWGFLRGQPLGLREDWLHQEAANEQIAECLPSYLLVIF